MPSVFVDTNILIYAHDSSEASKHPKAQRQLRNLIASGQVPAISAQVLQELYVNLVRKRVPPDSARTIAAAYAAWPVVVHDAGLVLAGIDVAARFQISLWDSLVVAAAIRAGATELWTEDLNEGQDYGGVRVVNPLRS
jgi:predicted nucleic acid-binding protein